MKTFVDTWLKKTTIDQHKEIIGLAKTTLSEKDHGNFDRACKNLNHCIVALQLTSLDPKNAGDELYEYLREELEDYVLYDGDNGEYADTILAEFMQILNSGETMNS